jgi:23S rRNA (uridine2552-2'-O)-methyltransferase
MATRWYHEKKREHFYQEAKRVGYRARSAFKLLQIQQKFHMIHQGDTIVDLGAAPGGWSQVAKELTGTQGHVVGIDLSGIRPLDGVQFLQGDLTSPETIERLTQILNGQKVDVVISDMSPDISGNYSIDQARSIYLCENALLIVRTILKPKGNFICKVFEGEDLKGFREDVKTSFSLIKQYSPEASRKSSSEIYIIAKSFLPQIL